MKRKKEIKQQHSFTGKYYPWHLLLCLAITFAAFGNVLDGQYEFVNRDDNIYVYKNERITSLSRENMMAIFSTAAPVYQPITTLSYALDYAMKGLDAEHYHRMNILLHLLCTSLVFFLILKLSGNRKEVATLAALVFGIHPMHVESVTWISGRKDLLFTSFYISALLFYNRYLDDLKKKKYLGITFIFLLFALLSKELAVTLPVALLLTDWYRSRVMNKSAWLEKTPFFLISLVIGIVSVIVQRAVSQTDYGILYSLPDRLLIMCDALVTYIAKLFLPFHLSAGYPWPDKVNGYYAASVYISPVVLLALIGVVFWLYRKFRNNRKVMLFGIGFFLLNIVLVLQWLPIGDSYITERYTYLSYTGLLFPIAVALSNLSLNLRNKKIKTVLLTLVAAWLVFLFVTVRERNKVWQNSKALWTDIIRKNPKYWRNYNVLGNMYLSENKPDSAKLLLRKSLALMPTVNAYTDLGSVLLYEDNPEAAIAFCDSGLILNSNSPITYEVKGTAFSKLNKQDSAISNFKKCIALNHPNPAWIYVKLAYSYNEKQEYDSAIASCNRALRLDKMLTSAYMIRSDAHLMKGNYAQSALDSIEYMKLSAGSKK